MRRQQRVEVSVRDGGDRDAAAVPSQQYWLWPGCYGDQQHKAELAYRVFKKHYNATGCTDHIDEELRLQFGRYFSAYHDHTSTELRRAARFVANGGELDSSHRWHGFTVDKAWIVAVVVLFIYAMIILST